MPERSFVRHWLQRLLPFGALLTVVAFGLAGYALVRFGNDQAAQDQRDEMIRRNSRLTVCEELNKLRLILGVQVSRQISESERFLRDHPEGVPGIPIRLIRRSLNRSRNYLDQLAQIECSAFAANPAAHPPKEEP